MTLFVLVAAALALITAAALVRPLVRSRGLPGAPATIAGVGAGVAVLASAAVLYLLWSNWSWQKPEGDAATVEGMVSGLVRRLADRPEDLEGWLMLGRSYTALGQYPLAARAYQRADRLASGRNAEALTGWAEALTLENEAELEGRAGRLFEQALAVEPTSGKALFFAAAAAQRRGELKLARERFVKLLTLDPPPNVRPILEQQVAALDKVIAEGPQEAVAASASESAPGSAVRDGSGRTVGGGAGPARVALRVTLAPELATKIPQGAPLFVLARRPGQPGPPLAVKRLAATFPQTVILTEGDAMLEGNGIAVGQQVEVVARVALQGEPTARSGDPFGQLGYSVGSDGTRELRIDRVTP